MTTPKPESKNGAFGGYTGHVKVVQTDPSRDWIVWFSIAGAMLLSLIPMSAVFYLDIETPGWLGALHALGFLAAVFLSAVFMLVGFHGACSLAEKISPSRVYSSRNALLEITPNGVFIQGLGELSWAEILSFENIPDSDSDIILYTTTHKKLLLTAKQLDDIAYGIIPALMHYLQAHRHDSDSKRVFRVLRFSWFRFKSWIVLGYLLAGATALALLMSDRDAFKTIMAVLLLPPMVAYLVWWPAGWPLSILASRRVKSVRMHEGILVSVDGVLRIPLRRARIKLCHATGLGYDIEFLRISPERGRTLYLAAYDDDLTELHQRLEAAI